MMKLKAIMEGLEAVLPSELIEEGDNSGLIIGKLDAEINHIRVALEATENVVDQAIKDGVDLLLVHHPMIFTSVRTITDQSVEGRKAIKLIEAKVALIAAHSNLDRAEEGLNQFFGSLLNLIDIRPLHDGSYICTGRLPEPMSLKALVERLSQLLLMPKLNYVGRDERRIEHIAFCTGSGMSLITDDLFEKADVYLTGDLKYHDAMSVFEKEQAVVDVTHFGSEIFATKVLYNMLQKVLPGMSITMDTSIENPIKQ